MRTALLQLCSSDDIAENVATVRGMVADAATRGAAFILTPEVTNCVTADRAHQAKVLRTEADDPCLAALRDEAARHGVHILIGSLALKASDPEGRFVNRSFLIGPEGDVAARYDKIHMFDVDISAEETYRESAIYRPGERAVAVTACGATMGLCICYDMRFPQLSDALAQAGADILTYPSAFSPETGPAHWHVLLRARAIETGCWVLAPAQTGQHRARRGRRRATYGHSLAVDPWGQVVLDAGKTPGVHMFDLDLGRVKEARRRIPALKNARDFDGPEMDGR